MVVFVVKTSEGRLRYTKKNFTLEMVHLGALQYQWQRRLQ